MSNILKTFFLLTILTALVVFIGGYFGGQLGIIIAIILSLAMNVGSYFYSDKLALSLSRAQPASQNEYPDLHHMVAELSAKMGIPKPKLYITPELQANAFATGRDPNHASVAVTQGIMQVLSKEELKGVIAHELAHIKNRDILIATVAAVLASMISFLANFSLFSSNSDDEGNANPFLGLIAFLVIPIAASLLQFAISRQREFGADETGAKVLGHGKPLARALINIERSAQSFPMHTNPAMSSLYISNPLGGLGSGLISLFSTHPKTAERVKRLEKIGVKQL